MDYREGQWYKDVYGMGLDSSIFDKRRNMGKNNARLTDLKIGTVLVPQPEPIYKETSVAISLVSGGMLTNVAWPGAQVDMNPSGILPGGVAISIHGLWEAPLSGQQVLVGFIEGDSDNAVVIEKYPYNASARPDLEFNHILPMTSKAIGPTDIALGHFTGSFIVFRGTLPVPGEVDIYAMSILTITALATMVTTVGGVISMTSGALISLVGVPGVNINAGAFLAAALGDIVTTLLGPQLVVPGPGRVPTGLTIT